MRISVSGQKRTCSRIELASADLPQVDICLSRDLQFSFAEKADVEINAKGRFSRGGDRSAKVLRVDIAFTPLLDAQRSALGMLALPDQRHGRCVFGPDA